MTETRVISYFGCFIFELQPSLVRLLSLCAGEFQITLDLSFS